MNSCSHWRDIALSPSRFWSIHECSQTTHDLGTNFESIPVAHYCQIMPWNAHGVIEAESHHQQTRNFERLCAVLCSTVEHCGKFWILYNLMLSVKLCGLLYRTIQD